MKHVLGSLVLTGALALAVGAFAHGEEKKGTGEAPKAVTLKGELVDMGCYVAHEARGAKHKGCATKCVAGGMPMGLVTADNQLYVLTLDHDDADPYQKAKGMMAAAVEVTGTVSERGGVRILEVTAVKAAPAAPAPASK